MQRFRFDPKTIADFEDQNPGIFKKEKLAKGEQGNSCDLPKERPSARHRRYVREAAKKLWQLYPELRIADMFQKDEIHKAYLHERNGQLYADKTIRKWIKDLAPSNKPGRPRKKSK